MNWLCEQQTLPMRVWKIGLQSVTGNRAILRELTTAIYVGVCIFGVCAVVCRMRCWGM